MIKNCSAIDAIVGHQSLENRCCADDQLLFGYHMMEIE